MVSRALRRRGAKALGTGQLSKNLLARCGAFRQGELCALLLPIAPQPPTPAASRLRPQPGVRYADRVRRAQQGQSAPVRADRACAEDRQEPDGLGLARTRRLPEGRGAARARTVAAAPGAT